MELLTKDAIVRLRGGEQVERPVLQILAYKMASEELCRVIMSDGEYSDQSFVIVGAEPMERLKKGEFERYTVVQLTSYQLSNIDNKTVITISNLSVVRKGSDVKDKIGKPKAYSKAGPITNQNVPPSAAVEISRPPASSPARPPGRPPFLGAGATGSSPSLRSSVCPISAINPYQGKFTIMGRVTAKSHIKTWQKPTSEGKLFSFDLQDKTGGIRVTCFNAECDRWYEAIELGQVVLTARGTIKQANRRFCDYEYEMSLNSDSIVEIVEDENETAVPKMSFDFKKISDVENLNENDFVDLAAVVMDVGEVNTIHSAKLAKELKKRDISLVDDSDARISLTLWNQEADNFAGSPGSVIVAKKLKVSEFNGRSLTTTAQACVQLDPKLEVTDTLKSWYNYSKNTLQPRSLTQSSSGANRDMKFLFQGWAEAIGSERAFVDVHFRLGQFARGTFYNACVGGNADRQCKKKVEQQGDQWYCSACNRTYDHFKRRCILSCRAMDMTGETWVTLFDDDIFKLFNWGPENLDSLNEETIKDACKPFMFMSLTARLQFRKEFYQDKQRIRSSANNVQKTDPVAISRKMLASIRKLKMG